MTEALKKKPLTDIIEQVNEEAWKQKPDDSPNKNYPRPRRLLPPSPSRRTYTNRPKTGGRRAYKSRRRSHI